MSKNPTIIELSRIDCTSRALTGGKAAGLCELVTAGYVVPEGFVVTTSAYDRFIEHNALGRVAQEKLEGLDHSISEHIDSKSSELRSLINEAELPRDVIDDIRDSYEALGRGKVAVRSSATAEDLPDASFAGQYDTSLNVEGQDALTQHIKNCFGSVWTSRAIAYREENRIPHDQVRVAVIVQKMVDAKSAGVMFTRNPVSENESEIMIESNFGLGESVVGGYAVPDRYIVNSQDFSLVSKEIGTKDTIVAVNTETGSGVVHKAMSQDDGQKSSLSDEEIVQLAKQGISIEDRFGAPQDVEWAIDHNGNLYILQSRPITVTTSGNSQGDRVFWTRGYSDDYWNDNVTPLFFDLLGDQLTYIVNNETNAIMGYKGLPTHLMKLFRAHVYFNLDVLKAKVVNEMPPFVRSDDLMNYFPEGAGYYGKETMRSLPFNLKARLMAEIRVTLLDPDGSMTRTADAYSEFTENVFVPYCEEFDKKLDGLASNGTPQQLMDLADELDKVMIRHFRLVRYGIPVHNLGMNLIVNYMLKRWLGERAQVALFPILVAGLEHKTSETNRRIYELAEYIRGNKDLKNVVTSTPSKDLYRILSTHGTDSGKSFVSQFDDFLKDFGVRGFTREMYYPRWGEEPAYVFDILKSLVTETSRDLSEQVETLSKKRRKAEGIVVNALKNQRFGRIKLMLFDTILGVSRTYIAFRENQRFNLDRWITRNRRLFLRLGALLHDQGYLERADDVFFLHRKEIRRILNQTLDMSASETALMAKDRHAEFKKYEDVTPPKFLHGEREFNDPLPDSSLALKGIPASQGIVTGKVRILNTIADIPEVKSGEILVVPRTDPGWTPVFSKIGGLVTETGGILSHGAVVSREFGIPAVTNIRNACQMLSSGQLVTLDGNQGLVIPENVE